VENVPGLGASGYAESTSGFKFVSNKEAAYGKVFRLAYCKYCHGKVDFFYTKI
jgi:hypothetical protein